MAYLAQSLTIGHVSVSTVWTSRLVIIYLKTIGAPIVYRRRTSNLGFRGEVHLASTPVNSTFWSC